MTIPKFARYACVGDSVSWERDGFTMTATIEQDFDSSPMEYECYSSEDVERWEKDDWFYCGLVVSVEKNGCMLSKHAASLWGLECNIGKDNDYLSEVALELEDEALTEARSCAQSIIEALTGE